MIKWLTLVYTYFASTRVPPVYFLTVKIALHDSEENIFLHKIASFFFQLLMQEDVRQYVMQNISSISSLPLIPPPPAVPSNKPPRTRFSEKRQNSSQNSHHTPHPSPPNRSYPAAQTPIKANQISTAGVNTRHCVLRLFELHFYQKFCSRVLFGA